MKLFNLLLPLLFASTTCEKKAAPLATPQPKATQAVVVGAARMDAYLPDLQGKRVALVVNHSALVGPSHLADTLLKRGVEVVKIFAPEHGFRGSADAGETVRDGRDTRTGLPVVSIYGSKKKPSAEDLTGVDVVVFDIQDVGARFYTYISTLFYLLEACADHHKRLLVLDRPNPIGHFVDGPVLEPGLESFIGIAPIALAHGCTVGELARMFVGEGWLHTTQTPDFQIVSCQNYDHRTFYQLPVKPSPNLPDMRSIYLYPSVCLFEGTVASLGRGTATPFQIVGHPDFPKADFSFVPQPTEGAKNPPLQGKTCYGFDLRSIPLEVLQQQKTLNLSYLLDFFKKFPDPKNFFLPNNFIDKLAGTKALREQILAGKTETEIRASWEPALSNFKALRKKYLLYPDF